MRVNGWEKQKGTKVLTEWTKNGKSIHIRKLESERFALSTPSGRVKRSSRSDAIEEAFKYMHDH